MSTSTYPVHVDARLDPQVSRGLWLVKWLLVIPHYVVLAFLWIAFAVLSVFAFFAILFTGRYPRSIFDFNVGVLRWSWRVAYYAYGALATDRYPPFSLRERTDFPAHLEVEYPENLSRRLVLVKWWLLAIPHYLIVGIFLGGGLYATNVIGSSDDAPWMWGGGLIGLLAVIAAVVLLFTGKYPKQLYDLVLGLNRWVLRVAAYAGLMTDEYPPFRLDLGGDDPGTAPPATPAAPAPSPEAPPQAAVQVGQQPTQHAATDWGPGRVVALVAGCLVLLGSIGFGAAGAAIGVAGATNRDTGGFLMSGTEHLHSNTYAITSTNLKMHAADAVSYAPRRMLGHAKLTATATHHSPVFIGIAATEDVTAYFDGVEHATLMNMRRNPAYRTTRGSAPAVAPTESDIWVASASGTGRQSVVWPVERGDWTFVVMNPDGSGGVTADVAVGATVPALKWFVVALLSVAGAGLVLAVVILLLTFRSASRGAPTR
jgi:hypothetical protein